MRLLARYLPRPSELRTGLAYRKKLIPQPGPVDFGGTDGSLTTTAQSNFNSSTGFMMMVPAWLYFGPKAGSISYYGYISDPDGCLWNVASPS